MRRRRSPARWLAPIALVACAVAVYAVVNATLLKDDGGATTPASQTSTAKSRTTKGKSTKSRGRRRGPTRSRPGTRCRRSPRRPASRSRASRISTRSSTPRRFRPASGSSFPVTSAPRRASGALVLAVVALAIAAAALVAAPPARAAAADGPVVRAPAAILVEPATGDVVYGRNADDERPVASTTKLMTALLTLEREKLSTTFTTIRYSAAPAESRDRPARAASG